MDPIRLEDKLQEAQKKPYEQPSIIYRAPLEATAGACGTSPGKAVAPCTVLNS